VGFDVVPSDCIAAMLKDALPDATHLTMAFKSKSGRVSPGTAKTILEGFAQGGAIRRDGKLTKIPIVSLSRKIPYASGESLSVSIPWGDVSTAFYSTGIPNIEFYTAVPGMRLLQMKMMRYFSLLIRLGLVQRLVKWWIGFSVKGPEMSERQSDSTELYGEVVNAAGEKKALVMSTPNGYDLTFDAAVSAVERCLSLEKVEAGAQTPSSAFGKDFVTSLKGVKIQWLA
jgi:short subunit dehydrogenase-like uncharacterized protein